MKDEVMVVSDKVVDRISKNEYGQISAEISQETATQLILGLCNVAERVSQKALSKVSKIYADALMRQGNLEMKSMEDEAEIMRRFNDQVDKAMHQLDLSNSETVDCFEKVCSTLRSNLLTQLRHRSRPSIFRIFGGN